jgi:hypothetical protein
MGHLRVFQRGVEYKVEGPTLKKRRLVFLGETRIEGKQILIFKPVTKVNKQPNKA